MTEQDPRAFLSSIAAGVVYGLLLRVGTQTHWLKDVVPIMSIGFIFVVPFAIGFLSIFLVERDEPQRTSVWIFMPCIPVLAATAATLLVVWEGLICAVFFIPVGFVLASLGGIVGGLVGRSQHSARAKNALLMGVLFLPMLTNPWEQKLLATDDIRTVENIVEVHAPKAVVWKNIERVRAISSSELPVSWSYRIGFPHPLEATLSYPGVGGVRHATFAGGVLFIETIDVWDFERRLGFTIRADTDQLPKTTLDDHVRVGGPFFDVLRGEYYLEPLPNGDTRLHLYSRHRLSTDFNWYARMWTDAVMSNIQSSILHVVKDRSESDVPPLGTHR
ncbi:MAG: hypothetical protein JWN45_729 [Acidobacteriaceae bacterium]|jgi:hypothetical protein|nr:hypothetical protein [Acidobacteriaceae bacterium]